MTTSSEQSMPNSDLNFDVRSFGASGTGLASDTHAIQRVIDAEIQVGGQVGDPPGVIAPAATTAPYLLVHVSPTLMPSVFSPRGMM